MGMFDSLIDANGFEWQTKALGRTLERYFPGDTIDGPPIDYQLEVIGGFDPIIPEAGSRLSFATIRGGRVYDVPVDRDPTLPLRNYYAGWDKPLQEPYAEQEPMDTSTGATDGPQ